MNKSTQKTLFSSNSDEWTTPKSLFDKVNNIFNFDLDVAASNENALCNDFYTIDNSALDKNEWGKDVNTRSRCWLNPPYSRFLQIKFIAKAYEEVIFGNADLVVALIPARTDTKLFQNYCFDAKFILFIKGRLKFSNNKDGAPFPSCLVFFGNVKESDVMKLADLGKIIKL